LWWRAVLKKYRPRSRTKAVHERGRVDEENRTERTVL